MFEIGQKVSLETFQMLAVFFPIELSFMSKNRASFGNSNHNSKRRESKENSQTILNITFLNFGTFVIFLKNFDSTQVIRYIISCTKIIYTSCLMSCPMTSYLGSQEISQPPFFRPGDIDVFKTIFNLNSQDILAKQNYVQHFTLLHFTFYILHSRNVTLTLEALVSLALKNIFVINV